LIVAVTLGLGIFYVVTRSLKDVGEEDISSTLGNAVGRLVHMVVTALAPNFLLRLLRRSSSGFTSKERTPAAPQHADEDRPSRPANVRDDVTVWRSGASWR